MSDNVRSAPERRQPVPDKVDLSNKPRLARNALLNLMVLNLSRIVPRSSKHWLFGHQGGIFAGNSKYLFLWMTLHRPDIRAVWLAHNEATHQLLTAHGLPCHRKWSLAGVWAALRSKVFFYCHGLSETNARLSKGALLVNLWHGIGIKSTMFGDAAGIMSDFHRNWFNLPGRLMFYEFVTLPDIVATTSDFMQDHFARQFRMGPERCPQLGYPRLDVVADADMRRLAVRIDEELNFRFNADGHDEVYVYMPTWRDTHRPFIEAALPDLTRLSALLASRNAVLYVKLHPWTRDSWPGDLDNIRLWPNTVEIYTYLDQLTGMITDYSSILYDYLFLRETGSIIYTFDYEDYISHEHTLLYPFDENTAGVRADSFDELCQIIATGRSLIADPKAADVRAKFWGDCRPPMSPIIVDHVEAMLRGVKPAAVPDRAALPAQVSHSRGLHQNEARAG